MSITTTDSNTTAPTQLLRGTHETYAYRRLGGGIRRPLLCLQHFTGTLDNWDPAVTDPLASDREVILFDSAGVGRSSGNVPATVSGMAMHALDFMDALCVVNCDILGFSLGGMVAQQIALERPSIVHRMILVGTAPQGGDDIMHLEKPSLARHLDDPTLKGYQVLQKIFCRLFRVRQPAERSSRGLHNALRTSIHRLVPMLLPRRSQRSATGSNRLQQASPISRASSSRPLS
jgi:pimeloyl-ACP methyl ester carboxylesterase